MHSNKQEGNDNYKQFLSFSRWSKHSYTFNDSKANVKSLLLWCTHFLVVPFFIFIHSLPIFHITAIKLHPGPINLLMLAADLFTPDWGHLVSVYCMIVRGEGVRYWDLPVGPWHVDELLPPPADHHCDVESQHKAHRYQAGEVVAMEDYALKYSASNKNHQHSPIWTKTFL